MTEYFQYGEKELSYLKQRDKRLSEIIDKVGWVKRRVIPNLFAALVHSIVGQQISTKAHETIWQRIQSSLGEITPQRVTSLTDEELQRFGISFKKVTYIKRAATKILNGEFDILGLYDKTDEGGHRMLVKTRRDRHMECRNAHVIFYATPRYSKL